eukprot:749835-Hanusia_phi.AAC.2
MHVLGPATCFLRVSSSSEQPTEVEVEAEAERQVDMVLELGRIRAEAWFHACKHPSHPWTSLWESA